MTITKFEFIDHFRDWQLNEAAFSNFNLLVGPSGVGKTRILKALEKVCNVGLNKVYANGCHWKLEMQFAGDTFLWEAETSIVPEARYEHDGDKRKQSTAEPHFLKEQVIVNDEILIDRLDDQFIFEKTRLPKLKNTESAISLLNNEESIAPLYQALSRVTFFDEDIGQTLIPYGIPVFDTIDSIRQRYPSLDKLRQATGLPILLKAYLIQEDYPDEFRRITADYMDIFDTVVEVKIDKLSRFDPLALRERPPVAQEWLVLAVKEEQINDWIISPRLSSGMLRTLIHLLELAMTGPGGVIMIDEFENSLGVNCLPMLTEHFLLRSGELQFILTSHHPYVINNVPMNRWKIVTRNGSAVNVLDRDAVPALNTTSSQEQFILLMNLKEYEAGVQ